MIKSAFTALLVLFITFQAAAQLLNVQDSLVLKIPAAETNACSQISSYIRSHFNSDSARVRAAFVWVANNIDYDVELLKMMSKQPVEKIATENVLKTRKSVCQGYAELLIQLLKECNIQPMLIPGYGRLPDGTITPLSHAWVAAEVNNRWWLYDPTWAAGAVYNDRFTRTFSNRYYQVTPEQMIRDHMPFDPMHQFLNYPVTADEFYDGKTAVQVGKTYFNYKDTLKAHTALPLADQLKGSARRIQGNGVRTELIKSYLDHLTKNVQGFNAKSGLDAAYTHYNLAIVLFNSYIKNKNERFASIRPSAIQPMIDSIYEYITLARADLESAAPKEESGRKYVYEMKNSVYQFSLRVDQEKAFLKSYLAK